MTTEVKINHLMGGRRNKKEQISQEFGLSEDKITKESIEKAESIIREKTEELNINLFDTKKRYNLTLENSTITKLDVLERLIKSGQNSRIGGLRSKLVDFIIEQYYDEFKKEIKGDSNEQ